MSTVGSTFTLAASHAMGADGASVGMSQLCYPPHAPVWSWVNPNHITPVALGKGSPGKDVSGCASVTPASCQHQSGPGSTQSGFCQHQSSSASIGLALSASTQLCQHQFSPASINPALPASVQPCTNISPAFPALVQPHVSIIPALPASVQHSQQHQSPTSTGPALHQHHSSPVSIHPALWLLPWPPRHAMTPNPCGGGRCPAGAPSPRGCSFKLFLQTIHLTVCSNDLLLVKLP